MKLLGNKKKKTHAHSEDGDGLITGAVKEIETKIHIHPIYIFSAIFAVLLIVLAIVVYVGMGSEDEDQTIESASICTEEQNVELWDRATVAGENSLEEWQAVVDEIKNIPEHERDPNCLYVIVDYYTSVGDPVNSRLYLDKLELVQGDSLGFHESLAPYRSIETLRLQTEFLEKQQRQINENGSSLPVL